MSKNIVFEGWLTKSPPSKRIWRTKWRRRWFALRQSGELPGQYFLDYYADRNCRRPKGTINLDLCEQVDAGLHMERTGNGSLDPKIRGSVFTIQTQTRTYHLEADCEAEMSKWVQAICSACGLRCTEDDSQDDQDTYQNSLTALSEMHERYDGPGATGPYIPISECITGVRAPDQRQAFTFDQKDIVINTGSRRILPLIKVHPPDCMSPITGQECQSSECESHHSEDDAPTVLTHCTPVKSFKKLVISPVVITEIGNDTTPLPPVPPRPPKTLALSKVAIPKDQPVETKAPEPMELQDVAGCGPRRMSQDALPPPCRAVSTPVAVRSADDEEDCSSRHESMQYYNMHAVPPAVDRTLKPRFSSHSVGHNAQSSGQSSQASQLDERSHEGLQYLVLDLPAPSTCYISTNNVRHKVDVVHGKSLSDADAYKTVDFVKTEAWNMTRKDAEAWRGFQY